MAMANQEVARVSGRLVDLPAQFGTELLGGLLARAHRVPARPFKRVSLDFSLALKGPTQGAREEGLRVDPSPGSSGYPKGFVPWTKVKTYRAAMAHRILENTPFKTRDLRLAETLT